MKVYYSSLPTREEKDVKMLRVYSGEVGWVGVFYFPIDRCIITSNTVAIR